MKKLYVEVPHRPYFDDDPNAIMHYLHNARRELAEGMLKHLHNDRHYVICIREEWPQQGHIEAHNEIPFMEYEPTYRMWVEVADVQYQNIVMPVVPDFSDMVGRELTATALEEIKQRIKRKWSSMWPSELTTDRVETDKRGWRNE